LKRFSGIRLMALALGAIGALSVPVAASATCFNDWGTAGAIVRKEGLITIEQLAADRKADSLGDIVKATLCLEDEGYIYRLVVRDKTGQLKSVTVQAQSNDPDARDR
jgi:hypothetical protein